MLTSVSSYIKCRKSYPYVWSTKYKLHRHSLFVNKWSYDNINYELDIVAKNKTDRKPHHIDLVVAQYAIKQGAYIFLLRYFHQNRTCLNFRLCDLRDWSAPLLCLLKNELSRNSDIVGMAFYRDEPLLVKYFQTVALQYLEQAYSYIHGASKCIEYLCTVHSNRKYLLNVLHRIAIDTDDVLMAMLESIHDNDINFVAARLLYCKKFKVFNYFANKVTYDGVVVTAALESGNDDIILLALNRYTGRGSILIHDFNILNYLPKVNTWYKLRYNMKEAHMLYEDYIKHCNEEYVIDTIDVMPQPTEADLEHVAPETRHAILSKIPRREIPLYGYDTGEEGNDYKVACIMHYVRSVPCSNASPFGNPEYVQE